MKTAEQIASLIAVVSSFASGEAVDSDEILRAWGFDGGEEVITEADVMSAEETFDFVRMAFGV